MYCYVLTYWGYEDSMLLPIFHEKKFAIDDFDSICQKAEDKSTRLNPDTGEEECSIYNLYHTLIDKYGFKSLDDKVPTFNLNDNKTNLIKDDSELNILLNITSF